MATAPAPAGGPSPNEQPKPLATPVDFAFPFEPYSIQRDFMHRLYETIEQGGLGIFESPTGTGKSLSLLCGALRWLRDHEQRMHDHLQEQLQSPDRRPDTAKAGPSTNSGQPSWITTQAQKSRRLEALQDEIERQERLQTKQSRLERLRAKSAQQRLERSASREAPHTSSGRIDPLAGLDHLSKPALPVEVDECWLGDYESEDEGFDSQTQDEHSDNAEAHATKLGDLSRINEKCMDMQKDQREARQDPDADEAPMDKRAKAPAPGCPMLAAPSMKSLPDRALLQPLDVEELAAMASREKACAYYAARKAVAPAELVVVPYNMLLHKSTRLASGLQLTNNVVIIDEAHNLMDTIANIHSVTVTGDILLGAHRDLLEYCQRYKARLKAKNLMYVKQLLFTLKRWLMAVKKADGLESQTDSERLQPVNEFLFATETDHVNLFKLLTFCERSEISRKLLGFAERRARQAGQVCGSETGSKHLSPLRVVETLFQALSNSNRDGRVLVKQAHSGLKQSFIRFLLLNPAVYFEEILQSARAVIVAGGTMSPVTDFVEQLTTQATKSVAVHHFACGHVVPSSHLCPIVLTQTSNRQPLRLTFSTRQSEAMMRELGESLIRVAATVPAGLVVFFPSYEYEQKLVEFWTRQGVLRKFERHKPIFREPRAGKDVDVVLQQYATAIQKGGAALFSVVGGKLSEGINFKDDLGRCVVMVGMPYPNLHSKELQEKMAFLRSQPASGSVDKGQEYYENLCLKAVNQSIGRAIRHRGDFAAVIMLDERYATPRVRNKLPGWMMSNLKVTPTVAQLEDHLKEFFIRMQE
ncbi:uncharacterized protein MONBRDRAFT_27452 [Monosiga brevicollis MX1]|uniref:DNA 5'-3' helicase n=1 Tax=Monosiga brevicollis TaxID=81824 RepID=A9V5B3_MONBE|nr:uncharacterized protein MONBRDRAFT_27452 [Monosiga brevicollis MX1]EDQ87249.1 predicted protein [Monosiga brevicollis MX1]|eukprot:XP_001747862.1 hypothetical protein [Monosiga brevicollis MX1]